MGKTDYAGINYAGFSMTNMDKETGIHYGVIHNHEVFQTWADDSEPIDGPPQCPKCNNEAKEFEVIVRASDPPGKWVSHEPVIPDEIEEDYEFSKYSGSDYYCDVCEYVFGSEEAFPDEPEGFKYEADGYRCFQSYDDPDIFIELSPYYTYAQFCSPCAPGAMYIMNWIKKPDDPMEIGPPKGYCLGHEWFESVMTGRMIKCKYCHGNGQRTYPEHSKLYNNGAESECFNCGGTGKVKEYIQKAPYPVYRVSDDSLVEPIKEEV